MTTLAQPRLTWTCPADGTETDDGYCNFCGRQLTREHLAAYQSLNDLERTSGAREEGH